MTSAACPTPLGRSARRASRLAAASLIVLALAACERVGGLAPVVNMGSGSTPDSASGSIMVQKGDSAYTVARRHNVPLRDLIEANRLSPPYKLEAGQRLVLPTARQYIVQRGDTLYGISRMNNVDVSELTRLNGLTPPYAVQAGQALRLPGADSRPPTGAPDIKAPATGAMVAEAPSSATTTAPTVGRGSGRSSIQAAELTPPGGSSPGGSSSAPAPAPAPAPAVVESPPSPAGGGVVSAPIPLTKPSTGVGATAAPAASASETEPSYQPGQGPVSLRAPSHKPDVVADSAPQTAAAPPVHAVPASPMAPTPPNLPAGRNAAPAEPPPSEVAAVPPPPSKPDFGKADAVKPDAKPTESKTAEAKPDAAPPPRGGARFLWPVKGRLISGYGPKPDGLHNDGLNIAASKGAAVVAADNGVVAYAGNELRGFGNLLLLKHADGWITAYAHLDRIEVERGATVKRGQTVGRVGQTGSVTSPQLHFELRKGSQAVDPTGQMDRKPVSEGAFRDGPPGPG
ncbi:peptidoglycan DD-metalloendopeptidase family protein [Azospirillum sp.]|uniref:peptidoglycan DD-metalloendopeptidase family protein n=1 Tax=Azospirillum sp. TaxID=34012 RepID=UPI00261DDAF8|nr:peptidoglycan DD-metalloendopeptidase family protein [Azospirillum sp.]